MPRSPKGAQRIPLWLDPHSDRSETWPSRIAELLSLLLCRQQQLHRLSSRHADRHAEFFGVRGGIDDLGVEQVFRIDKWFGGSTASDGDGLAEFAGSFDVVDAAADDAGLGEDGAVLALMPAVADADGA